MEFRFFEIYRSTEYLNILLEGIITSFILTVFAATIGFGFAIILAGVRYAKIYFLDSVSTSYTEFIRNTPLIVQMFFVTFGSQGYPFALLAPPLEPKGWPEAASDPKMSQDSIPNYIFLQSFFAFLCRFWV